MIKTISFSGISRALTQRADVLKTTREDFHLFYKKHFRLVRSVIFEIVGEQMLDDIVQEAFIKIWKNIESYQGESKITTWIYRVAVNTALDHLRSTNRSIKTSEISELDEIFSNPDSTDIVKKLTVDQALSRLNQEQRTVLILAYWHDLPLKEIAEILDAPEGTIKSRLFSARNEFKKILTDLGVPYERK